MKSNAVKKIAEIIRTNPFVKDLKQGPDVGELIFLCDRDITNQEIVQPLVDSGLVPSGFEITEGADIAVPYFEREDKFRKLFISRYSVSTTMVLSDLFPN